MTTNVRERLHDLAGVLTELKYRVREALAGELANAFANTVRETIEAIVVGERSPLPRPSAIEDDPWADDGQMSLRPQPPQPASAIAVWGAIATAVVLTHVGGPVGRIAVTIAELLGVIDGLGTVADRVCRSRIDN